MRIQVSEAAPVVIDYFTARSRDIPCAGDIGAIPNYTGDPALAAPVIEAMRARNLTLHEDEARHTWIATIDRPACRHHGSTPLVAALRCHVAAVYGNFLELPDSLLPDQLNYRNLWSTSARCAE